MAWPLIVATADGCEIADAERTSDPHTPEATSEVETRAAEPAVEAPIVAALMDPTRQHFDRHWDLEWETVTNIHGQHLPESVQHGARALWADGRRMRLLDNLTEMGILGLALLGTAFGLFELHSWAGGLAAAATSFVVGTRKAMQFHRRLIESVKAESALMTEVALWSVGFGKVYRDPKRANPMLTRRAYSIFSKETASWAEIMTQAETEGAITAAQAATGATQSAVRSAEKLMTEAQKVVAAATHSA